MASSREYLNFILGQLSALDGISCRPMMGEFLLYYRGKLFGGIYDNRLLVKPVQAALDYLRTVNYETPYPGVKPMLLVDNPDDRESLAGLIQAMYPELPEPKRKTRSPDDANDKNRLEGLVRAIYPELPESERKSGGKS